MCKTHLNGSCEYCRRYKADMILSTDGQTDKVKAIYPLQLCWAGGITTNQLGLCYVLGECPKCSTNTVINTINCCNKRKLPLIHYAWLKFHLHQRKLITTHYWEGLLLNKLIGSTQEIIHLPWSQQVANEWYLLFACQTFSTMFPLSYHHEIYWSYYQWPE